MNSHEQKTDNDKPLWQQISGIDPATEAKLDADARDEAIRKLVREVEARASVELERAETGKIPEGERTLYWDPLARICLQLEISRTKLSAYTRELTGMRAHEISDRIVAKKYLLKRMWRYIGGKIRPELEAMQKCAPPREKIYEGHRMQTETRLLRWVRSLRQKDARAGFAARMGFANPSRLSRACLLAHGKSIDEMEAFIVRNMVQKFFEEVMGKTDAPPKRQEREEKQKVESELTPEAKAIIDDAVSYALQGHNKEANVA